MMGRRMVSHGLNCHSSSVYRQSGWFVETVLQSSIDHEVDMSTTSSSIWTTTGILDHLTPPPSRDRGSSNKLAFTRAAKVYESFQIGMETPETPAELILENTTTNWNLRDIKRRRTSLENSEVINEPPASASSMAMQSATPEDTMGVIQGVQDDASPESINNLEDELANTSLIEDDQPDLSMALEEPEHNLCPSSVFGVPEQQPQEGVKHTKGKSEEPLRRVGRPAYKSAAKQHAPTVNEMTVVASIVGEVLMESIKYAIQSQVMAHLDLWYDINIARFRATASDSESRAGVKLFKRQAEAIFVEQVSKHHWDHCFEHSPLMPLIDEFVEWEWGTAERSKGWAQQREAVASKITWDTNETTDISSQNCAWTQHLPSQPK